MVHNKKAFISLGDVSADQIMSSVVRGLKKSALPLSYVGFGGDILEQEGVNLYAKTTSLSSVIAPRLSRSFYFYRLYRKIVRRMIDDSPDFLFLADWGVINLALAQKARQLFGDRVRIFFYPCPQVWIWRSYRIKRIEKYIDRCFLLFPAEYDFYKKNEVKTFYQCVGHPFSDRYRSLVVKKNKNPLTIGLFPGSRPGEVKTLWSLLMRLIQVLPSRFSFLSCVPTFLFDYVESQTPEAYRSRISFHTSVESVFQKSYVAVGCMGTILLESVYFETPIISCYLKNYFLDIYSKLFKMKYFSLLNLLGDCCLIPEVVENNPDVLVKKLRDYLLLFLNDSQFYSITQDKLIQLKKMMLSLGSPVQKIVDVMKQEV